MEIIEYLFLQMVVVSSLFEMNGWMESLQLLIVIPSLMALILILTKNNKELKRKNDEINNFNELRRTFINADDRLIYLKDENLKYIFVNTALENFYSMDAKDIIGKDDFDLTNEAFANLRRKTDLDVLSKRIRIFDQVKWEGRTFKTNKFPIKLLNGHYGVGAYIEDITEEVRAIEEKEEQLKRIQYLSFHDPLTGLYNRYFFQEELKRLDSRRNLPISIIMGDVDGLKLTNDIFGHAAGDSLLKKVAEVLKSVCREDDIIARMGGDEFVLLLPRTNIHGAHEIIGRIKERFSKEKIKNIQGNISLGCASKTSEHQDIYQLIENAELNMYTNKTLQQRNIKRTNIDTILKLLHEISPMEKKHSNSVYKLCMDIGTAMKLPEVELIKLVQAAFLHDIGKITLDHQMLQKDDLSEEEWLEMREHPVTGFRILNYFSETLDLAEIVLAHHERWDGSGYPKGLKKEEIPLLSRIIALAEYYDRMVETGEFRINKELAIEEIQNHAGTKFDPEIVDIFVNRVLHKADM